LAEDKPRRGGMLRVALAGDPPSLDMHQEQTFMVTIPMSPAYNTLVMFDPHGYPNVIGDVAKSWTVSEDRMTYTFTLHEGVKFHDGSDLTSADGKGSWDKIVSHLAGLAHPANFIYAKKYLDQDVNYYKKNVMGSGPFKLKEYVRGASIELERN